MSRRGRIPLVDVSRVLDVVIKHKDQIILPEDKIVPKNNIIWSHISEDLDGKKSALSLYTFVCNNIHGVRDLLNNRPIKVKSPTPQRKSFNESANSSLNSSISANDAEAIKTVTLSMSKHRFNEMVIEKYYKGRRVNRLKAGIWQKEVSERLWNATKLRCGFHFKYHHINNDITSGSINGKCTCGTSLKIILEGTSSCVKFHCSIFIVKGTCGKRQLRQPFRKAVAETLTHKSAELYRIECAEKFMSPGDAEPPFLQKAPILSKAKNEYIESLCFDKDPIVAISKMKRLGETEQKLAIRQVGYDPFFVHYWTNQQSLIYKKYTDDGFSSLKIDASGKLVSKILRADGTLSHHIFLYLAVIHYGIGQTSVNQMLSEAHDTGTIQNWLTQWVRSGILPPNETVCDSSRALLTAIVRTFSGFLTIERYCDYFLSDNLPECYVRIDVNHFIKIYANALKNEHRLIKKFYMGVIGKIILARELDSARQIIKSALIVSESETEGWCVTKRSEVACNRHKQYLLNLITGQLGDDEISEAIEQNMSDEENEDNDDFDINAATEDDAKSEAWEQWSQKIVEEIKTEMDTGISPNAHFCPTFSKYLLKDIRHLPMWSCVFRDGFGFGRVPATSAPVEGEFNKIKNVIFREETGKIRVDRFVEKHIKILSGQTNLVQANLNNAETTIVSADQGTMAAKRRKIGVSLDDSESEKNSASSPEKEIIGNEETNKPNDQSHIELEKRKETTNIVCTACQNGDEPRGAHLCTVCRKAVHIIDGCSLPVSGQEEGYGEERICMDCHKSNAATHILSTRFQENWKGQITGSKKKKNRPSRYLNNEEHLFTALKFPNNSKCPILKNGSLGVGAVSTRSEKKTKCVINTCAFDSLFQILLVNFAENKDLRKKFSKTENSFIKLTLYIAENGLKGPHVYSLRTNLLHEYLDQDNKRIQSTNNCIVLNCAIGISSAVLHAFRADPTCEEITKCDNDCSSVSKTRTVIPLTYDDISATVFEEVITEKLNLPERPCDICSATLTTTTKSIGTYMFFEVVDADLHLRMQLTSLPTSYGINIKGEESKFTLAGVVEFKPPYIAPIRRSNEAKTHSEPYKWVDAVGHYTAICPRPGGKWTEYDDLLEKEQCRAGSFYCCPSLLVFRKL